MLETQEKFLKEIDQLRKQNVVAEGSLELVKNQLISVANDSNRKQNNQQTQMQEVESVILRTIKCKSKISWLMG